MVNSLVNRKQEKNIQKLLNMMGRVIDKFVDRGDEYYNILLAKYELEEEYAPVFSSYMHILNMVDGISIMIKKGATDGIKPLLRSLFETSLYFEYMLKETKLKGVISYQVAYANNEIKTRKMFDHETDSGKNFAESFLKEYGHYIESFSENESNKFLYQLLESEPYLSVNNEWKRLKKLKRGNHPNWYNLYSDIRNLKELATYLTKEAKYNFLYKDLSSFLHGSQTMKNVKSSNGIGVIPGIRNVEGIENYTSFTIEIISGIYRLIEPRKFAKWYVEHISDDYKKITDMNIKVKYYHKQ